MCIPSKEVGRGTVSCGLWGVRAGWGGYEGVVRGAVSVSGWYHLKFGRCWGLGRDAAGEALGIRGNWNFLTTSTHPEDGSQTLSCIWAWSHADSKSRMASCLSF